MHISIITPNYNREQYLPDFIRSVKGQTQAGVTLYVGDDRSTDRSAALLRREGIEYTVLPTHTGRPSAGANAAIRLALEKRPDTDFFVRADSDDTLPPTLIEEALNHLLKTGSDWVMFNLQRFGGASDTIEYQDGLQKSDLFAKHPLTAVGIFKRSVIERVGFYDDDLAYDDWALNVKLLDSGFTYSILPSPYYLYRMHGGQVTETFDTHKHSKATEELQEKLFGTSGPDRRMERRDSDVY